MIICIETTFNGPYLIIKISTIVTIRTISMIGEFDYSVHMDQY